jgi:hypothetical protein
LLWLPGAVASIGGGPEIEIIIVDDGSSDGTAAWLDRLALADLRVVHINGAGRGPSAARNLALAAVRAPLVAFLDADDRWRPGKLAAQLRLHAASPEVGFSFTDYMHVTESGEAKGPCFAWWPCFRSRHPQPAAFLLGDALAAIYAENVVGTSTVVARTALLRAAGGFDEGLQQAEDWDLWLRLAAMAPAACDPVVHVDYMMHRTGSLTRQIQARLAGIRVVAERHRAAVAALDRSAVRVCEARVFSAEAEGAAAEGRHVRAVRLRIAALLRQPSARTARELAAAILAPLLAQARSEA